MRKWITILLICLALNCTFEPVFQGEIVTATLVAKETYFRDGQQQGCLVTWEFKGYQVQTFSPGVPCELYRIGETKPMIVKR